MTAPKNAAEHAVAAIVADLTDRRGLRQAWEAIDDDVREEIAETWAQLLAKAVAEHAGSGWTGGEP
ncbi:MAG TPA: hypothetical protein VHH11_13915 [Gammaproteobacteria bacterium]|nr:hypothetical protein [Gammaproteobacteria bacterium]